MSFLSPCDHSPIPNSSSRGDVANSSARAEDIRNFNLLSLPHPTYFRREHGVAPPVPTSTVRAMARPELDSRSHARITLLKCLLHPSPWMYSAIASFQYEKFRRLPRKQSAREEKYNIRPMAHFVGCGPKLVVNVPFRLWIFRAVPVYDANCRIKRKSAREILPIFIANGRGRRNAGGGVTICLLDKRSSTHQNFRHPSPLPPTPAWFK